MCHRDLLRDAHTLEVALWVLLLLLLPLLSHTAEHFIWTKTCVVRHKHTHIVNAHVCWILSTKIGNVCVCSRWVLQRTLRNRNRTTAQHTNRFCFQFNTMSYPLDSDVSLWSSNSFPYLWFTFKLQYRKKAHTANSLSHIVSFVSFRFDSFWILFHFRSVLVCAFASASQLCCADANQLRFIVY